MFVEVLRNCAVKKGEVVAIPTAGAYQLAMASNYNLAYRPAVLLVEDGRARLLRRREIAADLVVIGPEVAVEAGVAILSCARNSVGVAIAPAAASVPSTKRRRPDQRRHPQRLRPVLAHRLLDAGRRRRRQGPW